MTARPAVAVRALERRFGRTGVLRGITLDIMPGEVFVIVGPNGSGKTTLLEVLATLLTPTGGRAEVFGHDVERAAAAARRSIGYAPSSLQSFYPRLSGLQNLLFFGTVYGTPADALRRRALALLDRLSRGAAAG
jgi:ABC-type multidrug transport system ATPase subunit